MEIYRHNVIKSVLSLAIAFSGGILFCYAQKETAIPFDIKITYKVTYLGDSTDIDTKRSEEIVLLINEEGSLFESINSNITDSLKVISNTSERAAISFFYYKIWKDLDRNRIVTYDNTLPTRNEPGSRGFCYEESTDDIQWDLSTDTTVIAGSLCQIAHTDYGNRQWKAYFDPHIPLPDGPYKFCGLPGLIVRIVDEQEHWRFDLIGIEMSKQSFYGTLEPVSGYQNVEKAFFFQNKKFAEENFIAIQETMGRRPSDPEQRQRIYDRFKDALRLRSNWIEPY